jgi:hypothetical protein
MNEATFVAILTFLGAVLAAVMFVMDRSNRRVADSLPPDTMHLMFALLSLAETLAKVTPTTADDELVADLRKAFGPEDQPTVSQIVDGAEG